MQTAEILEAVRAHHRQARFALKQQTRLERALQSHIVFNEIGADPNDKTSLKKKFAEASKIIKAAVADTQHPLHEIMLANSQAVAPFEKIRSTHEKAMEKLAKTLPIWKEWGAEIKGFGAFGLAQLLAECGDFSNYSNVAKLWKRLGLAVFEGKRQGRPGQGASAETWIQHGYNAERRAIMWNIGQSLFKHQSGRTNKETGEVLAEPSHYRVIYDGRKLYERPRVESDGHSHNRAVRYMEKVFIADLWSAWRQAQTRLDSTLPMPAVPSCDAGDASYVMTPEDGMLPGIASSCDAALPHSVTSNCDDQSANVSTSPIDDVRSVIAGQKAA